MWDFDTDFDTDFDLDPAHREFLNEGSSSSEDEWEEDEGEDYEDED